MKHAVKKMRLLLSVFLIGGLAVSSLSCKSSDDTTTTGTTGAWLVKSYFKGAGRSGAVSFVLNNVPYVGLGTNASGSNEAFLSDFYKYQLNKWVKVEDPFPGVARSAAVAFVVNGKAYVGLGFDGLHYLKDFYELDPADDTWKPVADFMGTARYGSVAFAIDDKGYVGGGFDDNYLFDYYSYEPSTDTWEAKADLSATKNRNAFAFVIDGKAYVGGGRNNGELNQTFNEYDPLNDTWTAKNDLMDDKLDTDTNDKGYTISRELAVTFVLNGKGYVVGGQRSLLDLENWEYTPASDTWKKMEPFSGSARVSAVAYVIGNIGYVGTGRSSGAYFDDIFPFDPTAVE